jgi:tagatose-1,6-bisphosphate aldolase
LSSGLDESDIDTCRTQTIEQLGSNSSNHDLSAVMELSKREEEARLKRLREEDEELQKVIRMTID